MKILTKKQNGFALVEGLVLLALIGFVGFIGWKVYESRNKTDKITNSASTDSNTQEIAKPIEVKGDLTEDTSKPGYWLYTNKELGLSFNVPMGWTKGVTATKNFSTKGNYVTFDFNNNNVAAGVASRDVELGGDGSCYFVLGPYSKDGFNFYKSIKNGTTKDKDYAVSNRILLSETDIVIYEKFESGEPSIGSCLGASIFGEKIFADEAKYPGIEFFWGDKKKEESVPLAQIDAYNANPNAFITPADRAGFMEMVKSAKAL